MNWLVALGGGVLGLVLIERSRRRRLYWHGPHYRDHIKALASDAPLSLPPVKPLVAQKANKPFIEDAPVTPFPENVVKFEDLRAGTPRRRRA